ncbi:putative AAA+ ATPase domain-containing protein [Seiridium cardinale]|uniref:AAA+ ATPase domain-containing protein n=1 Tax=Seiridium cardinale TaxID=138064 RepID=A0ABR2XM47_9PEZI
MFTFSTQKLRESLEDITVEEHGTAAPASVLSTVPTGQFTFTTVGAPQSAGVPKPASKPKELVGFFHSGPKIAGMAKTADSPFADNGFNFAVYPGTNSGGSLSTRAPKVPTTNFAFDMTKHSSGPALLKLPRHTQSKETAENDELENSSNSAQVRPPAPKRMNLGFRKEGILTGVSTPEARVSPPNPRMDAPLRSLSNKTQESNPHPSQKVAVANSKSRDTGSVAQSHKPSATKSGRSMPGIEQRATTRAPAPLRPDQAVRTLPGHSPSWETSSSASDSDEDQESSGKSGRNSASDSDGDSAMDNNDSSEGSLEEQSEASEGERGADEELNYHSGLLHRLPGEDDLNEIRSSPLFTQPIWKYAKSLSKSTRKPVFTQYALLGASSYTSGSGESEDTCIFYNITAPSSVFICGNQGSGKSHTLSCFLENCLVPSSRLGSLPRPLTGIVFHYDTFISDLSGTPCEAAFLASHPKVKVRVLCAPTNIRTMKHVYSCLPGVTVEELRLKETDLNTKRMLDLMAVGSGTVPLYIHVIQRVLRDMRIEQQTHGRPFSYAQFKRMLEDENLTPMQAVPLQQRLETLESFMLKSQPHSRSSRNARTDTSPKGTDWTPKEGQLTIVDLSCPCVTPEMACSLFNICLSLFLEQKDPSIGRIAALDEAHKYMGDSPESQTLTNSLLSTIRLQRHLALRVIISTQEPTVSPKLLDLCSITVVHRFQSPDWLQVLKGHLAGLSTNSQILIRDEQIRRERGQDESEAIATFDGVKGISIAPQNPALEMMSHIVKLRTGEALVFAPSAFVGLEKRSSKDGKQPMVEPRRLDHEVMRVRICRATGRDRTRGYCEGSASACPDAAACGGFGRQSLVQICPHSYFQGPRRRAAEFQDSLPRADALRGRDLGRRFGLPVLVVDAPPNVRSGIVSIWYRNCSRTAHHTDSFT